MAPPRFRFIDGAPSPAADLQFWRDVDASDRLASWAKADLYLRELCRSRAWDVAGPARDPEACAAAERRLLRDVSARGYRLGGPDLDRIEPAPFAKAG